MVPSERDTSPVAVVTGGAQGIGEAIARTLAAEGWDVAICDVKADLARAVASDINGTAFEFDIADPESVASAASSVLDHFGRVQALVNNAGWDEVMPFRATSLALRERLVRVNLLGPMSFTHALLPTICENAGRIVNIGSDAGRVGAKGEVVYSAAKAGMLGFTRALAREVASQAVTVNAVVPGPTDTPLFRRAAAEHPDLIDRMVRAIPLAGPLGGLIQPDDVAGVVAFLLSDRARWITGEVIVINGGAVIA